MTTSSADGVVDLAGMLRLASSFLGGSPIPLSQTISGVYTYIVPLKVAAGNTYVAVPIPFSPGVDEALFLLVASVLPVDVEITGSGATPGPLTLGAKGICLWTAMPGKGIASMRIKNPDALADTTVMLAFATAPSAGEIPPFFA